MLYNYLKDNNDYTVKQSGRLCWQRQEKQVYSCFMQHLLFQKRCAISKRFLPIYAKHEWARIITRVVHRISFLFFFFNNNNNNNNCKYAYVFTKDHYLQFYKSLEKLKRSIDTIEIFWVVHCIVLYSLCRQACKSE